MWPLFTSFLWGDVGHTNDYGNIFCVELYHLGMVFFQDFIIAFCDAPDLFTYNLSGHLQA